VFRVGQKVVCVDASYNGKLRKKDRPWPVEGAVYTVGGFDEDNCLCLEEINRRWLGEPYGFYPHRFRPVVDISDLQAIVREQMLGKPRSIAPDKFDRQRITSAAPSPSPQHDAATPRAAPFVAAGQCDRSSLNSAAGPC
jgi:hypothetical protein